MHRDRNSKQPVARDGGAGGGGGREVEVRANGCRVSV